jgi:hypothetical protein
MYEAGASEETLGAFGLKLSDLQEDVVEVLPDVWPAYRLFGAMSTQWRTGMAGATGLDYAALPVTGDLLGMASEEIRSAFDDVRCMEGEALRVMRPPSD